jgi:integrase
MSTAVFHGAATRQPVTYQGNRVPNLYVRSLANGTQRFEFVSKRGGKVRKVTLEATSTRQAVRELETLKPLSSEGKIGQGSIRLEDLVARFFAEATSGEYSPRGRYAQATLDLYRQRLEQHVIKLLGNRRVRDIRKADAQALADRLALTLAGSTVRGCIVAIAAVMGFAEHRGLIRENPVVRLKLPSAQRREEPVYLTRPELDALLGKLSHEFRPIAATCALAGLRVSEALGLQWRDLDFATGEIAVARQLGRDGKSVVGTKTRSSSAIVGMPAPLAEELQAHRERQGKRGFAFIQTDALVFQTRNGRSPGRRNVLRAVQVQAEKLGLDGLGVHDLRHSCAGLLRDAGISDEDIAVSLRHSSSRVTALMYGGRAEAHRARVRAAAREALA